MIDERFTKLLTYVERARAHILGNLQYKTTTVTTFGLPDCKEGEFTEHVTLNLDGYRRPRKRNNRWRFPLYKGFEEK